MADGWQGSTVRAILENPRYTGYAFFGRWAKHETLLDPDDVAAGHVIRFRRATPDRIMRSRKPAHPKIIEVEDFTEAQLLRRSRAAGGLAASRKLERGPKKTKRVYRLRGRVRCGYCARRMEGTPREKRIYYRCSARSLVPGSPALNDHPKNVYLPEAAVIGPLNQWLGELFAPEHIDQTVAALVASQHQGGNAHSARDAAKRRLDTAETRLRRLQAAIEAGADPAAFVEAINEAQSQRAAARAELDGTPAPDALTDAEVYAMIDSLGDVGEALNDAKPEKLEKLYEALRLEMTYNAPTGQVDVAIRPARRVSACVRGGLGPAPVGGIPEPGISTPYPGILAPAIPAVQPGHPRHNGTGCTRGVCAHGSSITGAEECITTSSATVVWLAVVDIPELVE
nr:recombinase zinc beta ribbon domain-containing protein [Haloechinothrix halophila]